MADFCPIERLVMLTAILLTRRILVVGLLVCCTCVCSWVMSLPGPNGPIMQLLVLDLSLRMMLIALPPVASTMTGILDLVWTVWYMLMLLTLGSTRLSRMILGSDLWNVRRVSELLV